MKCIYFDVAAGFSPVMALGALIDMFKEESYANGFLRPFASSVYTQKVLRGGFEALLAHIDISENTASFFESNAGDEIQRLALKFRELSPKSDMREVLEAVCTAELVRSSGADVVFYGAGFSDIAIKSNNSFNDICPISPSGYALMKLLGAIAKPMPEGDVCFVGYGADSAGISPDGILRALFIKENRDEVFFAENALEDIFLAESSIF